VLLLPTACGMIHLMLPVRASRKLALPAGLIFMYTNIHGEAIKNCTQEIERSPSRRQIWRNDPGAL
jgi:hypothetical protein